MPVAVMKVMSTLSPYLPKPMVEKRTRMMQTMMPHCLELMVLPFIAKEDRSAFIQRMLNILLLDACEKLSEREWAGVVQRLRDWTGSIDQRRNDGARRTPCPSF